VPSAPVWKVSRSESSGDHLIYGREIRAVVAEESPTIRTSKGEMTLEELAEIQPGMARLMDEYGRRFWALYYAGKAGNWDLARYMLKEMVKLGSVIAVTRPKYTAAMQEFEARYLAPLMKTIDVRDWAEFEALYKGTLAASDEYHERFNKGFIRFRLPDHPPDWLQLEP
jgi:pentatricopeptide repeat protein